jgi:hypothetical protein
MAKQEKYSETARTEGKQPIEEFFNPHMVKREPEHRKLQSGTIRTDN